MNTPNRLLDEVARLVTDAAGAAQGVRREVETVVKTQIQRMLADMDVVTREEFEAVREMAIMAREDNERLAARLDAMSVPGTVTEAKPVKTRPTETKPPKTKTPKA